MRVIGIGKTVAVAFVSAMTPLVAILRIAGSTGQFYQAVAHCFVGGLLGAWLSKRDRCWCLWTAIALVAVELGVFFLKG